MIYKSLIPVLILTGVFAVLIGIEQKITRALRRAHEAPHDDNIVDDDNIIEEDK